MPRFQAFITDMDGTILPAAKPLSERTKATLRRVSRQGVSVVLCSGRSALSLSRYAREIGLAQGEMICFNGARVVELETGEVLARNEIDPAVGREMLGMAGRAQLLRALFRGRSVVLPRGMRYFAPIRAPDGRRAALYAPAA